MNQENAVQNDINPYLLIWAKRALPRLEEKGWKLSSFYDDPFPVLVRALSKARSISKSKDSNQSSKNHDGLVLYLLHKRKQEEASSLPESDKIIPDAFWEYA